MSNQGSLHPVNMKIYRQVRAGTVRLSNRERQVQPENLNLRWKYDFMIFDGSDPYLAADDRNH